MTQLYVGPNDNPDRYRLHGVVGAGSEGVLYRGVVKTASGAELDVAIKVLHPKFHRRIDEWLARWNEQVELLRSLQTPGVVTVRDGFVGPTPHEAGTADAQSRSLYLVMNWVDGVPLDAWARDNQDQPAADKLRTLLGVAAALDVMHEGVSTGGVPVLHGDIKPSNILVTPSGDTVLVDFGLMRAVPSGTAAAGVSGTQGYLAPEVQDDGLHSAASDRFSLGAVAYFLLTGSDPPAPFDESAMEVALSSAHPDEPHLVNHVLRMLATQPRRRPASLANWCAQLRESSLGVGLPNEPMRPVAPGRIKAAPTVASRTFTRLQFRSLTAAVVALLLLAVAAVGQPDKDTPSEPVVAKRSATPQTTSTQSEVPAVVDVAPTVLAARGCKNDKLGFSVVLPDGMDEVVGNDLFSACEGLTFADSPKKIGNTYAVPVMFNNVGDAPSQLAELSDGKEIARRALSIGATQALMVESRTQPYADSDSAIARSGYRLQSYLIPNARGTLVAQLVSPLTEKAAVYAEHKRLLEQLIGTVQRAPTTCRNEVSFHCGEFFWITEPHRDIVGDAKVDAPREAIVGEPISVTIEVSDPDGGDTIDVTCASFGDTGCTLPRTDGAVTLIELVRGRPDKPLPSGGWTPPRDHPGLATFVCRHTYRAAGSFSMRFSFGAAAAGSDIPVGHNPFVSHISSEPSGIVVKSRDEVEDLDNTTTSQPPTTALYQPAAQACTRA